MKIERAKNSNTKTNQCLNINFYETPHAIICEPLIEIISTDTSK